MLGIITTLLTMEMAGAAVYTAGGGSKSLTSSNESSLVKIFPRNKKSPAGEAELRYSFYYKTEKKYTASVVCTKLKTSKFIMEDSMSKMEKRIEEVFADFDKKVFEK